MIAKSRIDAQLDQTLGRFDHLDLTQAKIGLAVSGGGDSIAMLHLMAERFMSDQLAVFSVNHGLREEAAAEVALVRRHCAALEISFETTDWSFDGEGNLQAAARAGRWSLLANWADRSELDAVALGHTADDEVETFLMRLARGSGVDGLSGMGTATSRDGIALLRPLLSCSRADLREWLRDRGLDWADDPSNDDPKYDRVKARQMMGQLEGLGLTRDRVLTTIAHMADASTLIDQSVALFVAKHVVQEAGDLIFHHIPSDGPDVIAYQRAVVDGLRWVSSSGYKPRLTALKSALQNVADGQMTTLLGCILLPDGEGLRIMRELNSAPSSMELGSAVIWDGRWIIEGADKDGLSVRALGEDGILQCGPWRESGVPRQSLLASPSIWEGDTLIAAPIAGYGTGWSARIAADFTDWLVTH